MTHLGDTQDASKFRPVGPWLVLPTDVVVSMYDDRGNLNVSIQDQFTPPIDQRFSQITGVSALTVAAAPEDLSITVADGTEFTVGERCVLFTTAPPAPVQAFYTGGILSIVTNVITLDTPINAVFPIGSVAASRNIDISLANGSVTTEIYEFTVPEIGTSIDVVRFMFTMECDGAPDDSKFGNLVALTNGIVLRKIDLDGVIFNYWNIKTNGEFASLSYDVTYSDKAGGGNHGVRIRMTYGGQDKHGVTIRLEPTERLELLIQDDLTGLINFLITVQGHLVE